MIRLAFYLLCTLSISDALGSNSWYIQNSLTILNDRASVFEETSFSIPNIINDTAFGVQGNELGVNYRLRFESQSFFNPSSSSDQDIILQELSRDFVFDNGLIINLGKTQIQLDEGIGSQPLGFFQKEVNLSDVVDEQDNSEGLPIVAISYLSNSWSSSVIFSDDFESEKDGFNRGLKQFAIHLAITRDWGEIGVVVQRPEQQKWGFGAVGSLNFNDTTLAYFSWFGRRGTRRPFYQVLENNLDISVGEPFQSSRISDGNLYERYNIGVRSIYKGVDFTIEYNYDERGLSSDKWKQYLHLLGAHNNLVGVVSDAVDRPLSEVGRLNLSFDRQLLQGFNTRQKYALIFASKSFERWNTSLFTRYEIDSGGVFSGATVSHQYDNGASISVSLSHLGGRKDSEYRANETSGILEVFVKYLL